MACEQKKLLIRDRPMTMVIGPTIFTS